MRFKKNNFFAVVLAVSVFADIYAKPKATSTNSKKQIKKKTEKFINKNLQDNPNIKVIDKVLAIVYQEDGPSIIMQSDLRPGLDGAAKTIKDVLLERLMVLDAQNLKIMITDTDVERHLIQVQKQFKLSKDDTVELFKQMGYTLQEGKEQLRTKLMIEQVVDYRVRSKVLIDKKEIERYYLENPDIDYKISQAHYPINGGSPALNKIKIERAIEDGEIDNLVTWSDPISLKEEQIAEDKAFIKNMSPGSVGIISAEPTGIFLVKFILRDQKSLESREAEINSILGQTFFAKSHADYHKKLLSTAIVKFIDAEAKKGFDELLDSVNQVA